MSLIMMSLRFSSAVPKACINPSFASWTTFVEFTNFGILPPSITLGLRYRLPHLPNNAKVWILQSKRRGVLIPRARRTDKSYEFLFSADVLCAASLVK